ncbi:putative capsid protein [Sewage-associated circular DNA virus-17]|uniref:Putative capsid protein n=1 Tax=Sewage-associated circular DNA virus-17 TaxID=1592084 RepID=A0A0B4UGL4_9VIRU|nr:putative capsid protein [Sewage-associated circular DNA virus-17]AJD07526.1 putative capsid protein [Sewage-associated circular DNA virus-17]
MAFKRKRIMARRSGFKKRRISRKSRFARKKRGSGTRSWTQGGSRAMDTRFRSRKLLNSGWRRHLWGQTLHLSPSRSALPVPIVQTSGTILGKGSAVLYWPTFNNAAPSAGNAFWTTAGGLNELDAGVTAPTFTSENLIIRGGRIGITLTQLGSVSDDIGITVYTLAMAKNTATGRLVTPVPWGVSIDSAPDFAELGKILDRKDYIMDANFRAVTIERRLKCQKIDMDQYSIQGGQQIAYCVVTTNLTSTTNVTTNFLIYHDLSFSNTA